MSKTVPAHFFLGPSKGFLSTGMTIEGGNSTIGSLSTVLIMILIREAIKKSSRGDSESFD